MIGVHHEWKYPPAPQSFPPYAEIFLYNDKHNNARYDRYCGAWALPDSAVVHKFTLPGADRPDGFYSDPTAAREALNKVLEERGIRYDLWA